MKNVSMALVLSLFTLGACMTTAEDDGESAQTATEVEPELSSTASAVTEPVNDCFYTICFECGNGTIVNDVVNVCTGQTVSFGTCRPGWCD